MTKAASRIAGSISENIVYYRLLSTSQLLYQIDNRKNVSYPALCNVYSLIVYFLFTVIYLHVLAALYYVYVGKPNRIEG